jgi:UDP-glucose 4-epimerase
MGHVAALTKILNPSFSGWKVYNLGTGSGLSVLQLVKAFEVASGQKVPYEIVERRAGDIDASYADVLLAKKELCWEATKDVLDMCK